MNRDEAESLAEKEIKQRNGLDKIGDGKLNFRICLNMEAREKLLEQINIRMAATNHTLIWKLKYALDKAEFARTNVLTDDMAKVEEFLRDATRLMRVAIADFERDVDAYRALAGVAKQIKQSEAKGNE